MYSNAVGCMKVKPLVLFLFTSLVTGQALARNCQALVELQNGVVKQANRMFGGSPDRFAIVVCNNQTEAVFSQFYAQMHFQPGRSLNVPTAGLSPVNTAVEPDNRARTTGMLAAEDESKDLFNLKMRTRFSNGEALDYSSEQQLPPGKSVIFQDNGFTVGVVRLGQNHPAR